MKRVLAAWLLTAAVLRIFVMQPEQCFDPTPEQYDRAITETIAWATRTQQPDGRWIYRYDADRDEDAGIYEFVRHAGLVMSLYQAADFGYRDALGPANRGNAWALARATRGEGWIALGDEAGASALWLAALTYAPEPDPELLRGLGRQLLRFVQPNGSVFERLESGTHSPFYTGEVAWALARLHNALPGEGWDEPVARIVNYVATARDDAEDWFPPLPDHWTSYALAEIATFRPLTTEEERYAHRLAQLESLQIRFDSQRTNSWFSQLTRGHQALAAGLGTIGEALGQLTRVPAVSSEALHERTRCAAASLIDRQVLDASGYAQPDLVRGTWLHKGVTQIDDQQHAMSALLAASTLAQFKPNVEAPVESSILIAILLFVTASNAPLRKVGRARTFPAWLMVIVMAACSGPILDALDVSGPNARIAVGLALVVAAIVDLAAKPSGSLLRPEIALLAIQVGHDFGVLGAAIAAAIGFSTVIVWRAENKHLARGLSIVQVALAALLALDGIFAV